MIRSNFCRPAVACAFWISCALLPVAGRSAAVAPLPTADAKWRHYASPNFELYSRDNDSASRKLLYNLELLRSVFIDSFHLVERHRQEVTVYLFTRTSDFEAYLPDSLSKKANFSAYYASGPDRSMIVMGPTDDRPVAQQTIFPEYIHHLIRVSGENPPAWMNEGMAELFSTIEKKAGTLEFGRPSRGRLYQLQLENMMHLDQLLTVDHNSWVFTAAVIRAFSTQSRGR